MRALRCYYDGALVYDALYLIDSNGMRGMIKSSRNGEKKNDEEKNSVTDFYFGDTGNLHFTTDYLYQDSVQATLAFDYLKKQLFKMGYENNCFTLPSEQVEALNVWLEIQDPPQLQHVDKELTSMDNLAYLFEQMMLFDCEPTVTADFIQKLNVKKSTDEFEERASDIIQKIYSICDSEEILESGKIQRLTTIIKEDMKIFKEFQKYQKGLSKAK